jgi:eukaryotic-like serine/threonine-protein kinase
VNEVSQLDRSLSAATSQPADTTSANQIDLLCDAFEVAWMRGESPQIEAFLERSEQSERAALLAELLLVDRELCIRHGGTASRLDYYRRFPQYAGIIDRLEFSTIDDRSRRKKLFRGLGLLVAGTKLAHFELLEELGSGASGKVWKANDSRLQRTVAIKTPHCGLLNDTERKRFLREGQACAQLQHANIVAVYEVGEDQERVFIVSKYIEGVNLREWLKEHRPTPHEAAELAAQLGEAIHHAHEQGVIHRDLKPANVLLDRDGRTHITDFGLAKWTADAEARTVDGNLLGTPAYMSPEQARGEVGSIDRRSDVYGVGALLYEMLTGKPPFEGEVPAILHQVVHDDPMPPRRIKSALPHDLETICIKAMEKEPSCRYPSAQEMAVDLRRYLRGEPILARRTNLLEKSWRWLRRRPAVAALLVMMLVSAGAFGMVGVLARENRAMLGLRMVSLTTDPPGAKVAFVPLSETTGEPIASRTVYAFRKTPVRQELSPGDYLVVTVMSGGRFHEVFRHVPKKSEQVPFAYYHRSWRKLADGVIELPKVQIPLPSVTDGMALIEGSSAFQMGVTGSTELPLHEQQVDSFFIDTYEFTFGQYKKCFGRLPPEYRDNPPLGNAAMPVRYDQAVAFAEDFGKRLMTEAEFEFAATARGTSRHSWGDGSPPRQNLIGFGLVGSPAFDRLSFDPSVGGLCSNIAEWTSSWPIPYPPYLPAAELQVVRESRIIRGGSLATAHGDPAVTSKARNPRQRHAVHRNSRLEGLGFRCVRSAKPLIAYEDFPY